MKISEARKIVSEMFRWEMYHMGVIEEMPENINYSLDDMLKANRIVSRHNKVKDKFLVMGKTYRRIMQVTVDDRLIAALYVAMQYEAQKQSITCCNGKYIGVFK